MDETVKEPSIDGGSLLRMVCSFRRSLIHAPDYTHDLPSGYGSRHAPLRPSRKQLIAFAVFPVALVKLRFPSRKDVL